MYSKFAPRLLLLFLALNSLQLFNVGVFAGDDDSTARDNPLSPKGYLTRYWNRKVHNNLPKPKFLINKASPLTVAQCAAFQKLADQHSLANQLPDFCTKANLFCFPNLNSDKPAGDGEFASYHNKNFSNHGSTEAFKSYSHRDSAAVDTFQRYSHEKFVHNDKFAGYASNGNVADQSFDSYGVKGSSGQGQFENYNSQVNVPDLRFTTYSSDTNSRKQSFAQYSDGANIGDEKFTTYGKDGNTPENHFSNYGKDSNTIVSSFDNYGSANSPNDTFTSYGLNSNVPNNTFTNYGSDANNPKQSFKNYRDHSNEGTDNFQNYGKDGNSGAADFQNYGQSFNEGSDKFTGYGGNKHAPVGFKVYGLNRSFAEYSDQITTDFATYINDSSVIEASLAKNPRKMNKYWVEPGKFFREAMLKTGTIMPMADVRDKMPKRSFLPRSLVSKLPFSSSKLEELKKIFHAANDSSMETMLVDTLKECERAPSPGETKRCATSIEDILDFATSVLGHNVVVRSIENTNGYGRNITIGQVKGINGGKVTRSVSCHQSLFPYMVYYCHSVPKVRVYEADILDSESKAKINHGVAVCHLDTSAWSPTHGAFVALGSSPGEIEVCHWIFENDMSWTTAD